MNKKEDIVNITINDLNKRNLSHSPNSGLDYITDNYRRIFSEGKKIIIKNQIFKERLGICLQDERFSIQLINCEFKKGLFVRRGEMDFDYSIFIYKCNISESVDLDSFETKNTILIHNTIVEDVFITGKTEKIELYRTIIGKLELSYLRCEKFYLELSEVKVYSMYKFTSDEVEFDIDDIAISDYSRFVIRFEQSKKQVSEVYHRFALKAVKSLKASNAVNYQLTKATSNRVGILFGYFYKPLQIIFWILFIVITYSILYWWLLDKKLINSVYFSAYTFLTIGYGDLDKNTSIIKTLLVFSEGLLGIVYAAALIASIINSSKK